MEISQTLTKAEEEMMQMFWANGPSTVSHLISKMDDPKPPHSSISTIVRILERKGFIDHKSYGRTYEYFPIVQKKEYSKFSLQRFVSKYFEGSMNDLVSFMVDEKDLSVSDLSSLVEKLDNEKTKES